MDSAEVEPRCTRWNYESILLVMLLNFLDFWYLLQMKKLLLVSRFWQPSDGVDESLLLQDLDRNLLVTARLLSNFIVLPYLTQIFSL